MHADRGGGKTEGACQEVQSFRASESGGGAFIVLPTGFCLPETSNNKHMSHTQFSDPSPEVSKEPHLRLCPPQCPRKRLSYGSYRASSQDGQSIVQADKKKKARLDRFGKGKEKSTADAGELASKLAARAERFALSKPASQGTGKAAPAQTADEGATQEASKAPAPVSKRAQSIEEKNQAALAKAAAMVKPAANPEAEAKRQVTACMRHCYLNGGLGCSEASKTTCSA